MTYEQRNSTDDLDGRIHLAQMHYLDACKAVVVCGNLSPDDIPCAEGFLSFTRNGYQTARKCECWKARAAAGRELAQLGRQYERQERAEYPDLFPHISDGMREGWQAEKRADERRSTDPSRFHELEAAARRAMGGVDFNLPGEVEQA
jgi:hypothetical protein